MKKLSEFPHSQGEKGVWFAMLNAIIKGVKKKKKKVLSKETRDFKAKYNCWLIDIYILIQLMMRIKCLL